MKTGIALDLRSVSLRAPASLRQALGAQLLVLLAMMLFAPTQALSQMLVYNTEDSNDAPSQTILDFQRDVAQGFGMGGHSDGFQWIRVDDDGKSNAADIAGAASNAHTPVEADVGKKVRVEVSFTDDGICGRTPQVRDALLAEISGVSDCADVTATHLAAISGNLGLNDTGITALAAGDFAGLTALERLNLSFNELTTLDAGVFAELTALEYLYLNDNDLTTLDAGDFAGLTALERLYLDDNDLTTLSDDVFEELTALTRLDLRDNPGAPFAPEAVALPDDGKIPFAGGTLTLDGSGSGGAWGTNVTYGWALTNPASGVTVTFDDAASATTVVTIPALTADTELTFTLTVTGRGGRDGIAPATDTAEVKVTAPPPQAIVIEADWPKATGKIDWVRYTLTREGDPAQPVTVPVTFEGFAGNDWNLGPDVDSREVTFGAGSRTATQAILLSSTGDNNIGFSLSATQSGTLTARLGAVAGYDTSDTAEVQVVVIDGPAWVIRLTETAYTFTEDGGDQTIVVEATAASADMPAPSLDAGNNSVLGASVTAEGGTARIVQDYAPLNSVKYFESLECSAGSGVQVCQAEVTFTPVDDDLVEPDETLTLELARLPGNSSAIHYQGPDGTVSPTIKVYPATITDDDGPAMQAAAVEFAPALTPEGDAITFTVTLAEGATQQVTVDYATSVASDDTAAQTDFTAGSGTLTFAMGETEQTFTVSTLEDRIHESDETFTVTLDNVSPAGAATLPADPTATGTIVDDDDAPVLVLSVDSASIAEAGGTSTVTVSTGTGSTFPDEQTITLALSGTATETDDYTISSKSLTLSAGVGSGASSVTATVTAVDDALFEGDETVIITASHGANTIGSQTVTITDAAPAIVIEADWPKATGKIDWVRYTLTREGDPAQPVTVPVTFEGFAGNDWNLGPDVDSREVTFGAGSRTATQAILLSSTGDNNIGFSLSATQSGTLTARLGAVAGYDTSDTAEVQVVVIDGPAWVIRLTETAYTFTEDGGDQTIVVEATAASADMPAPSLDAGNNSVLGASVTAEGGTARIVQDYAPLNSVKYFESLECSAGSGVQVCQAEVTFTPVDDDLVEPDETLTLELARLPGNSSAIHYQGPDGTVSPTIKVYPATITDDDGPAMQAAAVEFAPALTPEGDAITFTVTLAEGATQQVTVDYATSVASDDTAAQTDFTAGSGTLTFAMGETEQTFTVSTLEDRIHESDETFTVTLDNVSPAGAATLPADPTATGTIVDDDDAPVLVLSVDSASIAEAGGTSTVTVSTGTGSTFPDEQTITLALSGTATETDDYTISSKSLTLSAGVGSGASSVTATVTAVDDALFEGDETVIITASHGANTIGSQTVTITDAAPAIVIEADWPKATGKIDWVRYTLTREGDPAQPVTVPVTFEGFAGNDWNLGPDVDSREVTFGAGSRTATQAILLSSTGDNNIGFSLSATQSGTLTARLGAVAGYDTSDTAEVQVVVIDGPAWVIRLTETAYTFTEDGGDQTIVVEATAASADMPAPSLDAGNNSVLGASVTAEGGTARIVQDYAPLNSVKYFESLECSAGSGVQVCQAEVTFTPVDDDLVEPDETLTLELARLPGNSSAIHYQGPDGTVSPTIKVYPATITDDDGPAMQAAAVEFAPALTPEGDAITFTVTLAEGATQQVTVDYATSVASDDTAAQTDFTAGSGTLTFAMGETEQTFTVSTLEDRIHESDETFTVTLDNVSPAGAATLPADPTATGTIVDDDDAPVLVLSVDSASIAEAGGTSTVTVSTGTGSTFPDEQTITLALSGTATETDDYTISSKSLTLSAGVGSGASSVTATVTAVDDALFEGDETLVISGQADGAAFGEQQTLTITDNEEAPRVTLVLSPDSIAEAGGVSTLTATVSPASAEAFTVTVTATADAPATEADFTLSGASLSFAANATGSTGEVTIAAVDNDVDAADKTVRVSGSVSLPGVLAPAEATLTIVDGDTVAVLTLEVAPATIAEDGGTATVTVTTGTGSTFGSAQAITLVLGGTATQGEDYTVSATQLTLPADTASVTATVTAVDDALFEGDETLVISGQADGAAFGEQQTLTITDNEEAPRVTLVLSPDSIAEAGGVSTLTATVSPASAEAFTVTVTATADAPATEADFTLSGASLSFAANATGSTGEVTIAAVDNDVDAADKTVRVSGSVSAAGVLAPAAATLTIVDGDTVAVLTLEVAPATIAEDGGTATVTVTTGTGSTFGSAQAITLVLGGTATQGEDYTVSATQLTLPADTASVTATVTAVDDALFEGDETLVISGQADGAAFGEQQTLTITDNEEAPRVTLVLSPDSIAEAGGVSTLTATVSPASAEAFTVTVTATADAPATEADFTLSGASLSFAANATGSTGEVTIAAVDNDVDAADKTVRVSGSVSAAGVLAPAAATLTIADDDEALSTVTLTVTPQRIGEGAGATPIEVTAVLDSGARASDTVITLSLGGGGEAAASPSVDYAAVSDFNLTIPANETSAAATFMLTPIEDRIDEPDETLTLTGIAGDSSIGVPEAATLILTDNDEAPELSLRVDPASIAEAGGTSTVTVSTGTGSTFPDEQTITLSLSGTATETDDYTISSKSLTLSAGVGSGASSVTATVTAVDDALFEGDETLVISGQADGAAFGEQQTLTITDNEEAPRVTLVLSPDSIAEAGGVSTLTATVSPASAEAFTVTVTATADAPATEADFTLSGASLSFAANATGSTGEVTIAAVDNDVDAADKTVRVSGSVSAAGVLAPAAATLTIADDDEALSTVTLTVTPQRIGEGAGATPIEVTAVLDSGARASDTVITLSLGGGGEAAASPSVDYAAVSDFNLTIPANETSAAATFMLTPIEDRIDEPDETLTLTGIAGDSSIGVPEAATLILTDNDEAPELSLRVDPASIAEAGGTSTVTVSTGTGSTFPDEQTITLSLSGTATETDDYTISSKSLTLSAGVGSGASSVTATVTAVDDALFEGDETLVISGQADGAAFGEQQTLTITDNEEAPRVTLVLSPDSIAEAGGVSTLTATVSPASAEAFTVTVTATADAPATEADFTLSGASLSFAANATGSTGEVTIAAVDNDVDAADKTVRVSGSVSLPGVLAPAEATLTIVDGDTVAVLTLEVAPATIAEDGGTATVTVTTGTGSTFGSAQAITLVLGGTATQGEDYTVSATQLTLPADTASVTATVTAVDDALFEGDETLVISGQADGAAFGEQQTLTITDNEEAPRVTLVLSPDSIAEAGGVSTLTATVSPASAEAFTVTVTATADAPATEADFTLSGASLSFAANATGSTGEVTIAAVDNDVDAADKTVRVSGSVSAAGVLAPAAATLTIADDDEALSTVTLTVTPQRIGEGAGATPIEVTAVLDSGARASDTVITLSLGGGGEAAASPSVDYAAVSDFNLTIPANETSAAATFMLTPIEDRIDEPDETLTLTGIAGDSSIGVPEAATLILTDNDEAPELSLRVDPASIAEAGGTSTVTVSTGTGSTFPDEQTITLSLSGTATETDDYTISSKSLTLSAGVGSGASSVTATVTAVDDALFEGDETLVISGQADGAAFGEQQTLTITDNEEAPRVTLVLSPDSIAEAGGVSTLTATVSPASAEAFTVTVTATADAPATEADFTLSGASLSFAANATGSTGEVTIAAVDNDVDAADKTVRVSGSVSLPGVLAPAEATLTIVDGDTVAVLTLEVAPATIAEDGGTATVTVTTGTGSTFGSAQAITLVLGGTATQGEDYTVSATQLTLPADTASVTATVTAVDDALFEGDETLVISGQADGAAFGEQQTLTITDNEEAPRVTLVLSPDSIAEAGGVSTLTATVSPASAEAFTVTVTATADAPATEADFTLSGASLSFAANATGSTGEVTIAAVDNDVDAADKTVRVSGSVSLPGVLAPAAATLTIVDGDTVAVLTLEVAPATIAEDGGTATVTVTTGTGSTFGSAQAITLVLGGTATQGEDYTVSATQLTLPADTASVTATVTAVDDGVFEGDETLVISGQAGGAAFGEQQTLTITDNEEAPRVTLVLSPDSIAEAGGVSTLTATVSPASAEAFTVTVTATADAPATEADFTLSGASLSFAANATGSTGEVTIAAVDNDVDAADKMVTVSGTVSRDNVTAPASVTITINDDDEPPPPVQRGVDISQQALAIVEGDEAGSTFQVKLIAQPSEPVAVAMLAPPGSGLTVVPPVLRFTPANWNIAQTVTVTAADAADTNPRTVLLSFAASGAGYEDVPVTPLPVTVNDPVLPELRVADARGREAGGQLVFDLTLNRTAEQAVSVAYATRDGTARAGEDYDAQAGVATIAAGERGARIAVPVRVDLFREPDEFFLVTLSGVNGARLADGEATGVIEDEAAMASQWLARFGRLAGDHVMAAVEEQISAPRGDASQVTVSGYRLSADTGAFDTGARQLDPLGQPGFGRGPSPGPVAGGIAAAGFGSASAGSAFGAAGRTLSGRDLLANSSFRLNAGPGGGQGASLWGRADYTRFDHLGEDLQGGGDALSATVGVDWACGRCLIGIALSHTAVEAGYGAAGQESGTLESSVTGLYPYFGLQLAERFSVWGLAGLGQGELIPAPETGARTEKLDIETGLAGLGARAELLSPDKAFSLAVKTDAFVSRATSEEAAGILEAEGEWRRVRLGLEGSWLAEFDTGASLRSSLEMGALQDAGDAENGLGAEVGASLQLIDVTPGLSLSLSVRGLVSHESEDYEEWGGSGGLRYDPEPASAAGLMVSLTHSWGAAQSGGLQQALRGNGLSRPPTPLLARREEQLSAEFAYGFEAFGALGIPWARFGTTGAGKDFGVGYSLSTHRGLFSLEHGQSALGRETRLGWAFTVRCRAQVTAQVLHAAGGPGGRTNTGLEITFRSRAPGGRRRGASCDQRQPLFTSVAPR